MPFFSVNQPLGKCIIAYRYPPSLVIGYARTCILHQLHSITIFYHHFRGRLTRNLISTQGPSTAGCALHAHWLILWPYLANSTNLGHLSPLFEAIWVNSLWVSGPFLASIHGDHSDQSPAHPVIWYFNVFYDILYAGFGANSDVFTAPWF